MKDTRRRPVTLASAAELGRALASVGEAESARAATAAILEVWGVQPLGVGEAQLPDDLEAVAWRRGLQDLELTGNRSMLRLLDLPALVPLQLPGVKWKSVWD